MNELLQKHGCSNVFTVPEGLKELMSDVTREVLRWQPPKLLDFIANYLSALLITREHGIMAVKILDDLCDCKPTVSEHLLQIGLDRSDVDLLAQIIKTEIEGHEPVEDNVPEKVKETAILKKVLATVPLDEVVSAKVCQIARNTYRDYWYRKSLLKKGLKVEPEEAWEKAAEHTLNIYKKTKPSLAELRRATEKIQAAYRGYHIRRNVLRHLMPQDKKQKKQGRKVGIPGPPLDIASSREIDLGPVVSITVKEDDVKKMFDDDKGEKLGLKYDPMMTIAHKEDDEFLEKQKYSKVKIGGFVEPPKEPKVVGVALTKATPIPTEVMTIGEDAEKLKTKATVDMEPAPEESVTHPRISFTSKPPEVIKDLVVEEDTAEVPEMLGIEAPDVEPIMPALPGIFEIPEEIDEHSVNVSSGPCSGHTTDIEDATVDDIEEDL